jgi:hypothetical protein
MLLPHLIEEVEGTARGVLSVDERDRRQTVLVGRVDIVFCIM